VLPYVASRRTIAPCPATFLSRADVVPTRAAVGCVMWCGWHGMQEVKDLIPALSHIETGQGHPCWWVRTALTDQP
jgi:hypothetical protein